MQKIYKGEIQRLMPIFQAMADGRIIQFSANGNDWTDIDGEEEGLYLDTLIDNPQYYRIKPETKYRQFKDAEECWLEMQKHQPFGWVKWNDVRYNIYEVSSISVCLINRNCENMDFAYAYQKLTFDDGLPFGVKVEE